MVEEKERINKIKERDDGEDGKGWWKIGGRKENE